MAPKSDGKYPDRLGQSPYVDFIDICPSIQKTVDWKKVADSGVRGVVIQSSRYSATPELAYDRAASEASAVGLAVGGYHYCACDSDPVQQALFFVRRLKNYGLRPGDIPPMMDLEYAKETQQKKGAKYVVDWGVIFMVTMENEMKKLHLKQEPWWYTFPNFASGLQPHLSDSALIKRWKLNLARYRSNTAPQAAWYPPDDWKPTLVPAGAKLTAVQYSGTAGYWTPGINQDTDRNVFFGSLGDWAEFRGLDRPVHQTEYVTKE